MPAPLSMEMREKIIIKHKKGLSVKVILEHLELKCLASVYNIIKLYEATGSLDPKPLNNGRKPMLDDSMLLKIEERIKEKPDITLEDLKTELNLPVCISALCRTLNNKLHLPLKKRRSSRITKTVRMS
jgi:transposase